MDRLDRYINELTKTAPDLKVKFKNASLLMKILGIVLFFNPKVMTAFATTIGNTIYLPSKEWLDKQSEMSMLGLISHEYAHIRDLKSLGYLFSILYLFPISLLPIAIMLFFFSPLLGIFLMLFCAAPVPAPGRMYLELRGYTMSMFVFNVLADESGMPEATKLENLNRMADSYNKHFTGFNYYLMWPFGVRDTLQSKIKTILSNKMIDTDVIYKDAAAALVATR